MCATALFAFVRLVFQLVGNTGINALASSSSGKQYGTDIKELIERVKRCKYGSKGQQRARRALKQRIDEIAIEVISSENPDLIVIEQLKNMGHKSKVKRLLTKNINEGVMFDKLYT